MFIENSGFKTRALARIFNPQKSEDFWDGKLLFNFPVPKTARSKTPTFRSGISAVFVITKIYAHEHQKSVSTYESDFGKEFF